MDYTDDPYRQRRGSFLGILLALFFGCGGVVFMTVVTGGFFLYVMAAVAAIGVFGYFHYLLWGHSLSREVAGEREEDEARELWEDENASRPQAHPPRRF